MLKITRLSDKLALSKNNNSRSTSSKNENNKPASKKNNDNNKINKFGVGKNNIEHTKKSEKLCKLRKLKSKKISKS